MRDSELAVALAALGHLKRVKIVRELQNAAEPINAGDLALKLKLAPNLLSSHLRVLTSAGITRKKQIGRHVYYSLDASRFQLIAKFVNATPV